MSNKYSKDPKVKVISLSEFLIESNYLCDLKDNIWSDLAEPEYGVSYRITPTMLIKIHYTLTRANFGTTYAKKLSSITIAYRDADEEKRIFDTHLADLELKKSRARKNSSEIDTSIATLKESINIIDKTICYPGTNITHVKKLSDYIIKTEYKTDVLDLKDKYVVIDVETNGLRYANDDLLSLSIYDPSSGECYNRYLPLDLQPLILTGYINGITPKTLIGASHITQPELDELIDYFDLKNRTILSYSGGQGKFDLNFILHYCKRHGLSGFENFQYENIKNIFMSDYSSSTGQLSKDNLCKALNIDGVTNIHSSFNDCIIEWKLFEKAFVDKLFMLDNFLVKYNPNYIIPVSYLTKYPRLRSLAGIPKLNIQYEVKKVFEFDIPDEIIKKFKKFPTNITGIALEHGINCALNAKRENNIEFLSKNKDNLKIICSLNIDTATTIPICLDENTGELKSLSSNFDDYIVDINSVTNSTIAALGPVFEFIKSNIFTSNNIKSQELIISPDSKVLALCDLSDDKNILEIKAYNIFNKDNLVYDKLITQLYYESNGRNIFTLSLDIHTQKKGSDTPVIDAIIANIYKIIIDKN